MDVDDLAVGIEDRATLGVERAGAKQNGVVGAFPGDRRHVAVGKTAIGRGIVEERVNGRLAAVEILVDAGFGKAVVAGDGVLETVEKALVERVGANLFGKAVKARLNVPGQFLERIAGDDVARQVRIGAWNQHAAEFTRRFVKDHHLVEVGIIALEDIVGLMRTGALGINVLLVIHALAELVDGNHGVPAQKEHARWHRGERQNLFENFLLVPGFVEIAQLGADFGRHKDQVPLIGRDRAAPEDGRTQIVRAHVRVVGETTRTEHHALVGAKPLGAVRGFGLDADHAAIFVDEDAGDTVARKDFAAVIADIGAHIGDEIAAIALATRRVAG